MFYNPVHWIDARIRQRKKYIVNKLKGEEQDVYIVTVRGTHSQAALEKIAKDLKHMPGEWLVVDSGVEVKKIK